MLPRSEVPFYPLKVYCCNSLHTLLLAGVCVDMFVSPLIATLTLSRTCSHGIIRGCGRSTFLACNYNDVLLLYLSKRIRTALDISTTQNHSNTVSVQKRFYIYNGTSIHLAKSLIIIQYSTTRHRAHYTVSNKTSLKKTSLKK